MSNRVILETKGLVTGYGKLEILHGVDIKVHEGEITAILGPNGAGKSTLLKTIAGLLDKWSGKVFYCGEDITNLQTKEILQKGLVYVMQGRNVFPYMTVMENLEVSGFMLRNKRLFKERLERVFEIFPFLKEKKNKKAHTLSGGEQRMLELAKAFINNPRLMMLDEPSIGLSPKIVLDIYDKILSLVKHDKISLILVEQNVSMALEVADKVYILDLGNVKFYGTPQEAIATKSLVGAYFGM